MLELKIYKNWNDLCDTMGWKTTRGNNKKARLKELDTLCSWHKEGNKIVIDEIYETKKEKIDNRVNNGNNGHSTTKYEEVDTLLLHLLSKSNDKVINITLNNLLIGCGLVNGHNWRLKNDIDRLSAYYKIPVETISDFCNDTTIRAKSIIESALNRLVKKGIIEYKLSYMLVTINENGTKEYDLVDDILSDEIEEISNNILLELRCKDVKECYLKRKIKQYYEKLNNELTSRKIANNIYRAYSIVIKKDIEQNNDIDIKESKKSINKKFIASCEKSLKSRVSSATNKDSNDIYTINKKSDKYVSDTKKIIDVLIDINTKCVYEKVINTKDDYISIKKKEIWGEKEPIIPCFN